MSSTTIIPNRGRTESDRLTRALLNLTATGQRPHCGDPVTSELWLSEHESERAEACRLCRGCPVILECGAAAEEERFGTWVRAGARSITAWFPEQLCASR